MGDFTDLLAAIPTFDKPARCERIVSVNGAEIAIIKPLDSTETFYKSQVNVQTTQGPMQVTFILPADSIEAACAMWQECARKAIEAFGQKMAENQRRIVMPGNSAANTLPFKAIN